MAQSSKSYLLLGENICGATGEQTVASWGKAHVIKNNGTAAKTFTLNEGPNGSPQLPAGVSQISCSNLLPVLQANHGVLRDVGTTQTGAGQVYYNPLTVQINPIYSPMRWSAIMNSFWGRNKSSARINFKLYMVRSQGEGRGRARDHNWLTITGTNGKIVSVADSFEHISLTLTAEIWRWQYWDSGGKCLRDVASAAFDPLGEFIDKNQHA